MKKPIYILSTILMVTIFSLSSVAQPWTWSEDTLSYARSGMTAATIDDTIFYSGGKITSVTFSNIWDIYDIGENQWDTYETSSNPRWNSAAVSAGGKVISAGGSNYPFWDNFDDVDIYDKETGVWTVEHLTLGRTITGGAVACENKVFFAGGHIHISPGSLDYTDLIDIYDTETNTWSIDNLSIPRCFIGGVAAGGKIYFAGGATGEQAVTNRIDIYNMETGEWTIDSLSEARAFIAAIAYGDKIYFAGGSKPYNVTSTLIEVYNIADSIWEDPMNLQTTRIVTALNVKNSLVFTGVCNYLELTGVINIGPSNGVVEIYYPETNQWEYSVTNLNPARVLYAHISYGNKAYYAGGGISAMTDKINILEYFGQCLPEGITFSTQEEIDNFQTNHPFCTEIEGGALIGGSVWGNDISNLNGLNVLTSIGGLTITFTQITNFNGLENLTVIDGGLNLFANPKLTSFNGLEQLISIEDDLIIGTTYFSGGSFHNMDGLNNLNYIGGHFSIVNNDSLGNLLGLENLTSIDGSLWISGNDNLTNLTGLDNLTSISGGYNQILHNDALINLSGMESLTFIEGSLVIYGNEGLVDLTGLENLTSIGENLTLGWGCGQAGGGQSIPNLVSLAGLDNLTSIGGNLTIQVCPVLTSLNGLSNLTSIGGGFYVGCNSDLNSLLGLDNLTSIGGSLVFESNPSLTSLNGLENLTSLGGDIIIGGEWWDDGNPALMSLSALDNIDAATIENIVIQHNDSLSDCDAQSICDYLASPNGTIVISDNAPGCNSQQEVQDDCDSITSVGEIVTDETFTISPNPLKSTSQIQYSIQYKSPVTIKILDLTGQEIKTLVDNTTQQGEQQIIFNTGDLPTGIYFCVLKTNEEMITKKIIKL